MSHEVLIKPVRVERRATIGQRPMVLGRYGQSAGTARPRPRPQFAKPPTLTPSAAEPGLKASRGRLVPGKGLGRLAQRGLQGRRTYPFDEGLT